MGYRFRVAYPVPRQPRRTIDIAFTRRKIAVFVDGCFWHSCPEHASSPQANSDWWRQKLERNVERDRETDALLAEAGWIVVRVWEHSSVDEAVASVVTAVDRASAPARNRPRGHLRSDL